MAEKKGQELRVMPGESPAMQRAHALCNGIHPLFEEARELLVAFANENGIADQQNVKNLIYEFDLKLREAWHRVNDLCAAAQQSPKAAEERTGG